MVPPPPGFCFWILQGPCPPDSRPPHQHWPWVSMVPPGGWLGPDTLSFSPQRDCQNYIKILLPLNSSHLFACGTGAFSPLCTYIVSVLPRPSLPTSCSGELF